AAIIRADARGWQVVFHCHDELVIEAPTGTIPAADVLALMLEPPTWAAGLPLGGKVHSGPLYLEAPATAEPLAGISPHVEPVVELHGDGERTQRERPKLSNDFDEAPSEGTTTTDVPWEGDAAFENPSPHASEEPAHICIHCHLQPPDGLERTIGADGAWLHPRCEDAYIDARLAEEGI